VESQPSYKLISKRSPLLSLFCSIYFIELYASYEVMPILISLKGYYLLANSNVNEHMGFYELEVESLKRKSMKTAVFSLLKVFRFLSWLLILSKWFPTMIKPRNICRFIHGNCRLNLVARQLWHKHLSP
jgi:hypothetical protein